MFKVIKRSGSVFGNEPYTCEFVCDTASDISTLPTSTTVGTGGKTEYDNQVCGSGSIATIAADDAESKKYILNNQDVWCPQSSNTNAIPVASTDTLGGVMVDGTSITANEQGVISAVGSGGGMELIGSYALTRSEDASSYWTNEIELPINLYENNRTLLIRTKKNTETSIYYQKFQSYTVMKITIPPDIHDTGKTHLINSSYFWIDSSATSNAFFIQILYYPETNKLTIRLNNNGKDFNNRLIDIYDMGVIE